MFAKPRLFTPGPTMVPEEVRFEMAKSMIHHRKKEFKEIFSSVQKKLKVLFGTTQPVLVLTSSGTGAMQAAVLNLFSPGEKVLVVIGGKFGERWYEMCLRFGLDVVCIEVEWGSSVGVDEIEKVLKQNKEIRGILVQASETSTGVLHPVKEIGELTKDKDVLLVVDGISAVGVSPCPMDKWNIDCLITGAQKGLMIPPGLSMISLSERGWEKAKGVKKREYYFDLVEEARRHSDLQTMFTPAINLIRGLNVALNLILEKGLEAVYKKHWALTCMVREGIKAIGLELFAKHSYSWGITSILLPQEVDGQKLLKDLRDRHNVVLAGGQGKLKGKIVRIGHMGDVDWIDLVGALYSLKEVVSEHLKLDIKPDFLERSIQAYKKGLENYDFTL